MGSRMAANLLSKGFSLTVWNRTPGRADELRAAGAGWAETPRDLAVACEVVCLCVADPAALDQVTAGPTGVLGGLSRGALVIDFSTVGPNATRQLEAACIKAGAAFLSSPVTGSKNAAAAGTLLMMCGGSAEAFAAAAPVLRAVGAKAIHVGTALQASQVKLMGNVIIAHMVQALSEAGALAVHSGVGLEKLLEVMQSSGFASPFWDFKGKALAARDFSTHFSVDLMHKDLTLALGMANQLDLPLPSTAAIREVFQMARARGLGASDMVSTAAVIDPALDES